MSINFPTTDEIPLASPPLIEVVCQVRIPPILQIAKDVPSDFQEKVRHRFPQFEWEQGMELVLPGVSEGEGLTARPTAKVYRFKTEDDTTNITLATDFYALSCNQYRHWVDFATDLQLVHEAMMQVYKPGYATRIGLRYINRLTLDNTGCASKSELLDLLKSDLTAILRSDVGSNATDMACRLSFQEEPAQLNMSLAYTGSKETAFILDFDYFERGKLPLVGLIERCNRYHQVIYDAFRWCLKNSSLQRFSPIIEEM